MHSNLLVKELKILINVLKLPLIVYLKNRMNPNVSKCIQIYPKVSKCIQIYFNDHILLLTKLNMNLE
jgi:hypothetical protein